MERVGGSPLDDTDGRPEAFKRPTFLDGPNSVPGFERIQQYDELAFAYLDAAFDLSAPPSSRPIERFYVVMALLRQSLELALKDAIQWWRRGDVNVHTHDLSSLWSTLERLTLTDLQRHAGVDLHRGSDRRLAIPRCLGRGLRVQIP